eukprot:GFUD01107449.1.p1 GENE.GFUD01107449.1~~GFUD01107449.1.p1  ORF type:complete len:208 (-),score=74.68 GFUD01107449.1:4-627(-)
MKLMSSKAVTNLSTGLDSFPLESLDKMMSKATVGGKTSSQETKTGWSHRLAPKETVHVKETNETDNLKDGTKNVKVEVGNAMDVKNKKQVANSWNHRLAAKHGNSGFVTSTEGTASESGEIVRKGKGKVSKDVTTEASRNTEEIKTKDKKVRDEHTSQNYEDNLSKSTSLKNDHAAELTPVKKPAWLKKLEELKLKNLDDMKTSQGN